MKMPTSSAPPVPLLLMVLPLTTWPSPVLVPASMPRPALAVMRLPLMVHAAAPAEGPMPSYCVLAAELPRISLPLMVTLLTAAPLLPKLVMPLRPA